MEIPLRCEPISLQEQYTFWNFLFTSSRKFSKGPETISQIVSALRVSVECSSKPYCLVNIGNSLRDREKFAVVQTFQLART